jgi:hypothetical protein
MSGCGKDTLPRAGNWCVHAQGRAHHQRRRLTTIWQANKPINNLYSDRSPARAGNACQPKGRPTWRAAGFCPAHARSCSRGLWFLMAAVIGLMLIACVNLAHRLCEFPATARPPCAVLLALQNGGSSFRKCFSDNVLITRILPVWSLRYRLAGSQP